MQLDLSRPIAFIDIESTGLDVRTARIIRITVLKLVPGEDEQYRSELVNPGVAISPGATEVHGLSDQDVVNAPSFKSYARGLASHLEGCDLAGFGIETFSLPLLMEEFKRALVPFSIDGRAVIDSMAIFHRIEPRDLTAAHKRFVGQELPKRQDAEALIKAKVAILEGELEANPAIPRRPDMLENWVRQVDQNAIDRSGRFTWSNDGQALVNFGRYSGRPLADVAEEAPDYLEWIGANERFDQTTRDIALEATRGRLPTRDPSPQTDSS